MTDVNWKVKNPCGDCPFLRTSPFHEGVAGSIPGMMESIANNTFSHSCHKTDNRPTCDGPRNYVGETPEHCAGSILMLLKTGRGFDLQLPFLKAADEGKVDIVEWARRAKAANNVFTVPEMLRFYTKHLARHIRRDRLKKERRKKCR